MRAPNSLEVLAVAHSVRLLIRDGAFYVSDLGNSSSAGDVVLIAAVPEPETWLLMAAGFAGIGGLRRRARRADR